MRLAVEWNSWEGLLLCGVFFYRIYNLRNRGLLVTFLRRRTGF